MGHSTDEDIREQLEARRYQEAFELLLDRYQNKVFRLCCSILADEALAEDATQEIFLRVWKALAGYRGQATLSTWLYSISRNACLTTLKQEAARRTQPLAETAAVDEIRDAGRVDVQAMLARLPEKYRRVLVLFYFEEKSYEDVAQMLGLPIGTVKTHVHRAKEELLKMSGKRKEALHGVGGV